MKIRYEIATGKVNLIVHGTKELHADGCKYMEIDALPKNYDKKHLYVKNERVIAVAPGTSPSDAKAPNKRQRKSLISKNKKKKVFIVHGRDGNARKNVMQFIEEAGFDPIILDEQASGGQTIIEKLEPYTNVGFGVILYTPCDMGGKQGEAQFPRARQNVVFEHGYLIAKLGRKNVVALVKDKIEIPNDMSGIVYIPYAKGSNWRNRLKKEMKNAGYNIAMK